jgi:hypothetical protein
MTKKSADTESIVKYETHSEYSGLITKEDGTTLSLSGGFKSTRRSWYLYRLVLYDKDTKTNGVLCIFKKSEPAFNVVVCWGISGLGSCGLFAFSF